MRSDVIVIVSPESQLAASIIQGVEDLLVEQLVAQAAVEAFDEAVLLRLTRINVMPSNIVIASPLQDRTTGELCAVITDNAGRLSINTDKRILIACHPCTRDACIGHQTQVLAAAIVIHGQHPELA